jgi:hypothetical protein
MHEKIVGVTVKILRLELKVKVNILGISKKCIEKDKEIRGIT